MADGVEGGMSMPLVRAPTVSIGMASFNSEPHIRKALDCLLAQTFTDFELIISDDVSTDRTAIICRDYAAKDKRIRFFQQKVNLGVFPNYHFVLQQARGKYFMWAEDNDVWMPTCIEECVRTLSKDHAIHFVVAGHKITSRWSPIFNRWYRPDYSFVTSDNPIQRVMAYSRLGFHSHKDDMIYALWKREVIAKILSDIIASKINKALIGGAMNDYALALYRGAYLKKVLWHKTYRYIPPGHRFNPIATIAVTIVRAIRNMRSRFSQGQNMMAPRRDDHLSTDELLSHTETMLGIAGLCSDDICEIIDNHKRYRG